MRDPQQQPPELGLRREGQAAPADLQARRRQMNAAVASGAWRTARAPSAETLGGVRVLRFRPVAQARGTLLHLHGGGFRLGCPEMMGPFAEALADRCGLEVVCPAYGLAPEHPFPGGLADAHAVLAALRAEGERPLYVSGDSAGGGLAAALTALAVAEGAPPSGLALLSAWLDLTCESACFADNAETDPLFGLESASTAANLYLQDHDARDPLASPLFADLSGFPPTFVSVGAGEVLADDSRRFYARLRDAGGRGVFLEVIGMDHVAVTRGLALPGAPETFAALTAFLDGL